MKALSTTAFALIGSVLVIGGHQDAKGRSRCPPIIICPPPIETCPLVAMPAVPAAPPAATTQMVPKIVIEKQKQTVTRYRRETRERLVTVNRQVPETRTIEEEYTVMVPEQRTRMVDVIVDQSVPQNLELRTTEMTPFTEIRQATQTVCRMVPVEEERTVREVIYHCDGDRPSTVQPATTQVTPRGLIRTVSFSPDANANNTTPGAAPPPERDLNAPPPPPPPPRDPNAPPPPISNVAPPSLACNTCVTACDSCTPCCVPEVVCKNVKVTCLRPVSQQETVEYPVTRFEPNVSSRQISFTGLEPRRENREEQYTVDLPQKRTRTREVTVMRTVPVQETERYQVMIPHQEQIEVSVPRLRWIPQSIPPPAPPPTFNCGGCGY